MRIRLIGLIRLAAARLAAGPTGPAVLAAEFINEHAPYPQCHASTLVEVSPGILVAAWFGGTKERAPDVGIWVAREEMGHWSDGVEVANGIQPTGPRLPTWNPVLFQPKGGPLALFGRLDRPPGGWWGMMMTSGDGGRTWSPPRRLPDGVLGPIKDKPVALADGAWLCPSSTENSGWQVHFEITRDAGQTWQTARPAASATPVKAIQPTILSFRDGRLEALCRTSQGFIAATWSSDGGRTSGPLAAIELPNPTRASTRSRWPTAGGSWSTPIPRRRPIARRRALPLSPRRGALDRWRRLAPRPDP